MERSPPKGRPSSMARGLTIYLTLIGWLIWAFSAGLFTHDFSRNGALVSLPFAAVLTFLLFLDLLGLRDVVRKRRRLPLKPALEAPDAKEALAQEGPEGGAEKAPEGAEKVAALRPASSAGLLQSLLPPLPEGATRREIRALGLFSILVGAALYGTNALGRPLFLPEIGAVKMAIALSLSAWLFLEPLPEEKKSGILAARTGIGLGLFCFAADLWVPLFGVAGVLAGALAIYLGRWGVGIYAILVTAAAWALQWTGRAGGPWE